MTIWDTDWKTALEHLKLGRVVTRSGSVWKNQEMRLTPDGEFQERKYCEGETEWKKTERHTFQANIEATDWIVREP